MHVAASTGRVVAGRYLLQEPIGRGAMGTVWRARDSVLARDVAVKEVRLRGPSQPGSARAEDTRVLYERSLREARTAARLNHPAVVTVFDVIEADGSPWIVMELVEARSLEQVLAQDGPLPPDQAADLGQRVLSALSCAHQAGILHRDVKPSNVLLGTGGRTVLTDFGIATLEGDPGLTQAGMVMGTPGFTAPERVRGDPATPASDLWSLGATLFAAVEGRGPFDRRGSSMAILAAIANEEPPRPVRAGPLRPVIEGLLRRDPGARPSAATAARLLASAAEASTGVATAWPATEAPAAAGPAARPATARPGPARPAARPAAGRSAAVRPAAPSAPARAGADEPGWAGVSPAAAWGADPPPSRDGGPAWGRSWPAGDSGPLPTSLDGGPADGNHRRTPDGPSRGGLPAGSTGTLRPIPARRPSRPGLPASLAARMPDGLATRMPSGRGTWVVALAALAMVILVITVVVARAHRAAASSGAPATGYRVAAVSGATDGSASGFRLDIPAGWQARPGRTSVFSSPAGTTLIQVTPTAFGGLRPVAEARLLEAVALRRGTFPGYRRITLHAASIHGHPGALWEFTWQPAQGPRDEVREALLRLGTPAGPQGYLVQESAPVTGWTAEQAAFSRALSTLHATG